MQSLMLSHLIKLSFNLNSSENHYIKHPQFRTSPSGSSRPASVYPLCRSGFDARVSDCCGINWCQQLWAVSINFPNQGKDTHFGACKTYLAIASRNLLLYSLGLVTVGLFLPPPANPLSFIQLSNFLSHV
jgi:hypothetical protein